MEMNLGLVGPAGLMLWARNGMAHDQVTGLAGGCSHFVAGHRGIDDLADVGAGHAFGFVLSQ